MHLMNVTLVVHFLDTCVCVVALDALTPASVQLLESALLDSLLEAAVVPVVCAASPTTLFPSSQLSMNML